MFPRRALVGLMTCIALVSGASAQAQGRRGFPSPRSRSNVSTRMATGHCPIRNWPHSRRWPATSRNRASTPLAACNSPITRALRRTGGDRCENDSRAAGLVAGPPGGGFRMSSEGPGGPPPSFAPASPGGESPRSGGDDGDRRRRDDRREERREEKRAEERGGNPPTTSGPQAPVKITRPRVTLSLPDTYARPGPEQRRTSGLLRVAPNRLGGVRSSGQRQRTVF